MLAEVFLAIILVWFSRYAITTYLKRRNMPPGPIPYPFIGNLPHILCDPVKPFAKLAEKYGDIYSLSFANVEAIVVGTDELIREARVERKDDIAGRDPNSLYPYIHMTDGDVFAADFSPVLTFRKRILKAGLHIFGSGIEQASGRARNAVDVAIKEINSMQGCPFSPKRIFEGAILIQLWDWLTSNRLTMNDPIIKDLAEFGYNLLNVAAQAPVYNMLPFLKYLPLRFNPQVDRGIKLRNKLFPPEFEKHIKSYNQGVIRDLTDGFISAYEKEIAKETKKDIGSYKDIHGLMIDVVNGGSDTTVTSICWFVLHMVLNPNIQAKVHEELDLVVGRDRLPCWNDAQNMPYLQAVLCEVQRSSSIIAVVGSNAVCDTTISGYQIKKGTFVALNLYKLHHDEKVWPEPKKFKPERFLDSDGKFAGWNKVYGFLPFGLGRRECPGRSMGMLMVFTFVSNLLHRYKLELPEGAEIPTAEPAPRSAVLRPQEYKIVAQERFGVQN